MEKIKSPTKAPLTALVQSFDAFAVTALTSLGRTVDQYGNLVNKHRGEDYNTTTKTYANVEGSSGDWWIVHPDTFARNGWKPEIIQALTDLIPEDLEVI